MKVFLTWSYKKMIKEEYIDKIAVANKTINSLETMMSKVRETKRQATALFLETNMRFDPNQRVRVNKLKSTEKDSESEFLGFGYVVGAACDEDYGIILYDIRVEDKMTKEKSDKLFFSRYGVHSDDSEYCTMILDIA